MLGGYGKRVDDELRASVSALPKCARRAALRVRRCAAEGDSSVHRSIVRVRVLRGAQREGVRRAGVGPSSRHTDAHGIGTRRPEAMSDARYQGLRASLARDQIDCADQGLVSSAREKPSVLTGRLLASRRQRPLRQQAKSVTPTISSMIEKRVCACASRPRPAVARPGWRRPWSGPRPGRTFATRTRSA